MAFPAAESSALVASSHSSRSGDPARAATAAPPLSSNSPIASQITRARVKARAVWVASSTLGEALLPSMNAALSVPP